MILSFLIGIVLRLMNLVFHFFPFLATLTSGISTALNFLVSSAMPWNFILPISDTLGLVVRALQFQFGLLLLYTGKYVVELIRGK